MSVPTNHLSMTNATQDGFFVLERNVLFDTRVVCDFYSLKDAIGYEGFISWGFT